MRRANAAAARAVRGEQRLRAVGEGEDQRAPSRGLEALLEGRVTEVAAGNPRPSPSPHRKFDLRPG